MAPPTLGSHDEERHVVPMDSRLARRLLRYGLPYRRWMALAVVLVLLVTGLDLAGPLIVMYIIDVPLGEAIRGATWGSETSGGISPESVESALRALSTWVGIYLLVVLLYVVVRYGQAMLMSWIGKKVMFDVRMEIFSHLQRMPMTFFDRNPVGRLVTRISNDVEALNQLFTSGVVTFVADVVVLVGIAAILLRVNAGLALVTLSVVPFLLLATFVFRYFARKYYREQRAHLSHLNAFTQESIQGMDIIQLFVREEENRARFGAINERYRGSFLRTVVCYSVYYPVIEILSGAALVGILWWGGYQIELGIVTFGEFYLFWKFLNRFFNPIRDMAERYNVLQAAMAAAERIFRVLDAPESIRNRPGAVGPESLRGHVEFRNVTFGYTEGERAVRNLSFTVQPGETVAIVGATGAGKSTVVNLLTRFYEPQQGEIFIDEVEIRDYDKHALRRRMALVLQDPYVFTTTILENIRLGNPKITVEAAREAAQRVRADSFIRKLPGEYGEPLSERGVTLSVGERQLLSFARALAHDPDILILDEATSHIDSETEKLIQKALEELLRNRTSIVIAHRLSTIKRADRILVFHKGELREAGKHRALLERGGIYSRLYQLQFPGDARGSAAATFSERI